jgi:predicted MFS family arabinose efflux permease
MLESGFTPAALAHLADISSLFPEKRGVLMGLYSVLLGVGQLAGGWLGGPFVETWGFNGILYLTFILIALSVFTVLMVRRSGGDQLISPDGHGASKKSESASPDNASETVAAVK